MKTARGIKVTMALLSLCSLLACSTTGTRSSDWQLAYRHDARGNPLEGSKQQLVNAIRSGADVRVGWGHKGAEHTIEHLSDTIWLAILDGSEVLAHLDPQVLSSRDWDKLTGDYRDAALLKREWRVVLTSKGEFDAVWIDRNTHEQIRHMPQRHPMSWFVRSASSGPARPLYDQTD